MSLTHRFAAIAALTIAFADTAHAQQPSLVGTWRFELTPTGNMRPRSTSGTLAIDTRQDTLVATLRWDKSGNEAEGAPVQLVGRWVGDRAIFTQSSEGTVNANGHSGSISSTTTWSLLGAGNELQGNVRFEISGIAVELPVVPLRGTRVVP